jgi:NAD(P)-dependent dehydrogenase (short-subunit alcohol dehydrogenase family)
MASTARVAVVTGGNRGIGREIARQLAAQGLWVVLTARDGRAAEVVAAEFSTAGLTVQPHQLDVTDPASVARLCSDLERVDVLVNNAGAYYDTDEGASTADLAVVQAALDVHLLGPWRLCEALIPRMRARRYGRIVNVSSGAGSFAETAAADSSAPAYSVAKAAQNMLTLKLAAELGGTGVLVNAACPGWVRTDMGGPAAPRTPADGADTPVWLATLPDDGPTGGFFRDRHPIPW